jgi:hypothetical protein
MQNSALQTVVAFGPSLENEILQSILQQNLITEYFTLTFTYSSQINTHIQSLIRILYKPCKNLSVQCTVFY